MTKQATNLSEYLPRVLLLGIQAPYNRKIDPEAYFDEFLSLVKTNGTQFHETVFMKIREISPVTFLTKGRLAELKQICEEQKIREVIISETLTPQQERNLSDFLNVTIYDRTRLILEIFEKSAHSAEGKTQVAIAMLQHQKTRLAGKGVNLSQQRGVIGLRSGSGETAKEREKRDIETQIQKFREKLEKIQQSRDIQRKNRISSPFPQACLIGYTNAGKSTILNALTKSNVLAEDKLFATLDTTTREFHIGSKKSLISDTVGFIQNLPHKLIDAFKSTLDELRYADLLLQVVDLSDKNWEAHISVVNNILKDLNIEKNMLYIFNKIDRVENLEKIQEQINKYQPHVLTNAQTKEGLEDLYQYLSSWMNTDQ